MALKPDPVTILHGIAHTLSAEVLPELRTPHATAQVHYAMMLLRALAEEWDGAALRLGAENAALRALLAGAEDAAGTPPGSALPAAASAELLSLSVLADTNDALRGRLVDKLAEAAESSALTQEAAAMWNELLPARLHGALGK